MNIGGIIIIDFIDMEKPEDREKVIAALANELKKSCENEYSWLDSAGVAGNDAEKNGTRFESDDGQ